MARSELINNGAGDELRHRDVVSVALRRLKRELQTEPDDVLRDVIATVREHGPGQSRGPSQGSLTTITTTASGLVAYTIPSAA